MGRDKGWSVSDCSLSVSDQCWSASDQCSSISDQRFPVINQRSSGLIRPNPSLTSASLCPTSPLLPSTSAGPPLTGASQAPTIPNQPLTSASPSLISAGQTWTISSWSLIRSSQRPILCWLWDSAYEYGTGQETNFPAGANVAQAFGHDAPAWAKYQCPWTTSFCNSTGSGRRRTVFIEAWKRARIIVDTGGGHSGTPHATPPTPPATPKQIKSIPAKAKRPSETEAAFFCYLNCCLPNFQFNYSPCRTPPALNLSRKSCDVSSPSSSRASMSSKIPAIWKHRCAMIF
jgi:hypothetical protein